MNKNVTTYYTRYKNTGWGISGYLCNSCKKRIGKGSKLKLENHVCKVTKYKKKKEIDDAST